MSDGTLLIDDRDGSKELMLHEPVRSTGVLTRLDYGDVAIVGNGPDGPCMVGVEVKSIYDLISSINSGRLQATQLPGLMRDYEFRWFLYYSAYKSGPANELLVRRRGKKDWSIYRIGNRVVPFGYVESFLVELSLLGVHIHRSHDLADAAAWVGVLHRWWSKPWTAHKGMRTIDHSRDVGFLPNIDADTRVRIAVAHALPGVGFERALAAARHFPSVAAMMDATVDEWCRVDGIGKTIAKSIVQTVKG